MTCKTTNRYVEAMCPAVAQAATFQKKKKKNKHWAFSSFMGEIKDLRDLTII